MISSNAVGTVSPDEAKKLFNSAGVYESAEQKLTEESQQQSDVGILSGVVCLVELKNGDESLVSVNATLLSLGATISPSFGEHLTHFITSKPSMEDSAKQNKRILAAELLDIFVVSTEWLEQCKCTNKKANESDFHIQSSLMAIARKTEQDLVQNQSTASLQSHQYSDHTEDTTSAIRLSRANSHHSITNIEELERVIYDDTDTMLSTIHNTSKATAAATSALSVPMPTFREYIPPVVPQRVLETVAKRRRSERISDLVSDTESETENKEEDDVSKRQKMESWEYVQDISVDAMLPIVFLPGREGDKLPPFVLHNGSNAYSTTKNGGSGIQGLSANGKKTSSGTGNNGTGSGSSISKGKASSTGGSTTVAASTKDTSASSKAKDNKDPPVVFKNKVVIAYTGFDDKHGERSTLLQTLRQLIKTIKRRAAEGDVVITPIMNNINTTVVGSEANDSGMDIAASNTSNPNNSFNNYNEDNTSSTSINSLEETAVSPQVKKKVGRPRSVSTNSRDSSSNTAKDKNNAIDKSQKKDTSKSVDLGMVTTAPITKHTHSKNNFVASEEEIQGWHIEAFECSVSILTSQSDYSAAACTHVIVNSNSSTRTLRRLFAMARGTCLVTEEWLHSSVSSQSWAPVGLHLHPSCAAMFRNRRDELGAVIKDRAPRADVFRGIKVCVVDSANPPLETLTDLVQAAGAVICYQIGERNVQYAVFGDVSAAFEWTTMMARKKRPWATKVIADVKALAELGKCVTAKFVFNCIGEGKLREPTESDGELITIDNLMGIVTNDSAKKTNSGSAKKAQQAALTDVTSMEVDQEYYFMDTSVTSGTATASVNNITSVHASGSASKDSTRRSRHSIGADPDPKAVVDLTTVDNPAPGPSNDPSSGKKKTIAEERLQRQLSNDFLPAKSRSGKKTTTDVHGVSAGDKHTTGVSATTATAAAPKSAIASLLGTWIQVRMYGYGMRPSKQLTAALPAVGEDINYTPMYAEYCINPKSVTLKGTAAKSNTMAAADNCADNKSTGAATTTVATTNPASNVPPVSTAIDDNNIIREPCTLHADSIVDNAGTLNTTTATNSPTTLTNNKDITNAVRATTSIVGPFASPFASPLARTTTLCDDIPPFSYPEDTGTDTGTAQSSAAPTPMRTNNSAAATNIMTNITITAKVTAPAIAAAAGAIVDSSLLDNNTASRDHTSSIQSYPSNTQLIVDSLLELSRTTRNNNNVTQKSATDSQHDKPSTSNAKLTGNISIDTTATTKSTETNAGSTGKSSPLSNVQVVAVAAKANSALPAATASVKVSKIRSASVSSDGGRRGSVFSITVPYDSAHMRKGYYAPYTPSSSSTNTTATASGPSAASTATDTVASTTTTGTSYTPVAVACSITHTAAPGVATTKVATTTSTRTALPPTEVKPTSIAASSLDDIMNIETKKRADSCTNLNTSFEHANNSTVEKIPHIGATPVVIPPPTGLKQVVVPVAKPIEMAKSDTTRVAVPVPVRNPVVVAFRESATKDSVANTITTITASEAKPIMTTAKPSVSTDTAAVRVLIRSPLRATLSPAVTSHSHFTTALPDQSSNSSGDDNNNSSAGCSSSSSSNDSSKSMSGSVSCSIKINNTSAINDDKNKSNPDNKICQDSPTNVNDFKCASIDNKDNKDNNDTASKPAKGSPSSATNNSTERRVSYSMSVVAPEKVPDSKNSSNVSASPSSVRLSTDVTIGTNNTVPSISSGNTPVRSAPYVPIKITTTSSSNNSIASGTAPAYNRGLATSQRFSLPTRISNANSATVGLKRKSQFVDPYQNYDSASKLNKSSTGNILYAHTNTNSIYNASSTPQLSYGVYNTGIVKPITKNKNNTLLEDDIQEDDSSQEKRKSDQASLRGRVGGTAPFRSSYPLNSNSSSSNVYSTYGNSSNNSTSGQYRSSTAPGVNTSNNSGISTYNASSYSATNRSSLPSSTHTSSRDASRPTHTNPTSTYNTNSSNSSVVTTNTSNNVAATPLMQYRMNSNIYMRRSPLTVSSPNAPSTSSAADTPNSAYTANTSKKSNLHAPRLSSSNLAALTHHASVGPAAKGLLIKKGKPVRSTTDSSALNSTNLAVLGSRSSNPLNDAGSDAESEQLIFTPASPQNVGAANKG